MHLVFVTWAILFAFLAIAGAFIVLFVIVCLLEKVHLDDFVPAPGGEALTDSPYFAAMNDAAKRLGFVPAGVLIQSRGSRIYQAQIALWVSPEGDILLQIAGGKTAGVTVKRTILYSVLSTNQILQTQDSASVVDLSGLTDHKLLVHADLDELLSCHRERLASRLEGKRTFAAGTAYSDRQSILRMRAEEMERMGLVKFLNQRQTIYRYTFAGAWLQYQKGLRAQTAEAISQADGNIRRRPGSI